MSNNKQINTRIQHKHDIESNWIKALNFIPKVGEIIVYDPDENYDYARVKIGDGLTPVNELKFSGNQPDWNQNDSTQPDYIKNRTHWEEVFTGALLEETVITNGAITSDIGFVAGNEYGITFNGVEYSCVATNIFADRIRGIALGNLSFIPSDTSLEDTNEPFVILVYPEELREEVGAYAMIACDADGTSPEECTLSVSGTTATIHKIDEKYLPDEIRIGRVYPESDHGEIFNNYGENVASGSYSHAEGFRTTASDEYSHAEGYLTTASGFRSHAEGSGTTASGAYSHAEGHGPIASGSNSHAEGYFTKASGYSSHAEGDDTTASGYYSHAEGYGTTANSKSQHVQGEYNIADTNNTIAHGTYAHIVGNGSASVRSNAHTLDWEGNAWFAGDVYVGSTSGTNKDEGSKKLVTEIDLASKQDKITGTAGQVVGFDSDGNTVAQTGVGKNVEGVIYTINETDVTASTGAEIFNDYINNKAIGQHSHAEGSQTISSGPSSHAEGYNTTASGPNSHTEGQNTIASGPASHAEGFGTKASDVGSHAEGNNTTASAVFSHAEGISTTASGMFSHSEGNSTIASGFASHSEGNSTEASGYISHAEGVNTIASGDYQHVQGKSNISDTTFAHIVGNGSNTARSNAHTLDWDGNAWFAGDVYVGSTSGTNKDEGSKKLVTVDEMNAAIAAAIEAALANINNAEEVSF